MLPREQHKGRVSPYISIGLGLSCLNAVVEAPVRDCKTIWTHPTDEKVSRFILSFTGGALSAYLLANGREKSAAGLMTISVLGLAYLHSRDDINDPQEVKKLQKFYKGLDLSSILEKHSIEEFLSLSIPDISVHAFIKQKLALQAQSHPLYVARLNPDGFSKILRARDIAVWRVSYRKIVQSDQAVSEAKEFWTPRLKIDNKDIEKYFEMNEAELKSEKTHWPQNSTYLSANSRKQIPNFVWVFHDHKVTERTITQSIRDLFKDISQ